MDIWVNINLDSIDRARTFIFTFARAKNKQKHKAA